jgi:hypothetical protein
MSSFVLHAGSATRESVMKRLLEFLVELPESKPWRVTVEPYKKRRSTQANAYLWGVCYATILRDGGEALRGWDAEDLHEYFLGEHFGWEETEGFGRKRLKPVKRSSKLGTMEFVDFVDFVKRKSAEFGIYIPDANEEAA